MAFGITAAGWIGLAAAGIGAAGAVVSSKNNAKAAAASNQAQLEANQVDPRIQAMLYGDGTQKLKPGVATTWGEPDEFGRQVSTNSPSDYTTNNGLLGQYTDAMNKPQDWALGYNADMSKQYIADNVVGDTKTIRNGALQQMQGNGTAPSMQAAQMGNIPQAQAAQLDTSFLKDMQNGAVTAGPAPKVQAAMMNSPSQNNLDLQPAYRDIIYGEAGANPYLTGAIDKGIHQSQNAFGQMQRDATQNFNESIMPGLRGGALLSGQYGGTRQGIAEGRAASDYSKNEQRAIQQMNQYNTDAAVAAQAQAYQQDMDRKAQLMQSLGGQQYGAAATNAANQQSANSQTAAGQLQTNLTNAQLQTQMAQSLYDKMFAAASSQAGLTQQTNLANQGAAISVGQNNMNAQNTTNNANLQSQLTTNQLNSNNLQTGMANLGGLLGSNVATAQAQDQYDINKMNNGLGVLAPYLAKNATPTQLQPVYNNSTAAGLGGALAGAQLGSAVYNGFQTNFGGSGAGNPLKGGAANGYGTGTGSNFYDGYGWGT